MERNFIRSAIEPESIETAIVQNIIWNSINNANEYVDLIGH